MRKIVAFAVVMGFGAVALAQQAVPQDPSMVRENPRIFIQPDEPPPVVTPAPQVVVTPTEQAAPAAPPPCPPPPPQCQPTDNDQARQNVAGRDDETSGDQHQRLYDQWNAPEQSHGGYARVTVLP